MTATTTRAPADPAAVPPDALRAAVELYLDLHTHPELSGAESRTAAVLAARLEAHGYAVTRDVGGHGVVGVLHNGDGPTVALRTELDALPLQEATGLPYASTVPGVMHACGHDLHLAAVAGAAGLLAASRSSWRGTVLVYGQPAEETLTGARAMLADGLYERFGVPGVVLGQHTAPLPAGTLGYADGPLMAGSVTLDAVLHGRGGHAGAPQLTVDPVLTAAAAVLRLQSVVSRETAPAEQVVLTVGSLHAGERANVVPDTAELGISVRAFSPAALRRVTAAVHRILRAEAAASGSPREPEITESAHSPVLLPDAAPTAAVREAHRELFGAGRVRGCVPMTAAEDFGWYGGAGADVHGSPGVATVYWTLGATSARQWRSAVDGGPPDSPPDIPGHHSPGYAPDVRTALPTGIAAMHGAARRMLRLPVGGES